MAVTRVWLVYVFPPGDDEETERPDEIRYENDGSDPTESDDLAIFLTDKYGEGWELVDYE